MSDTLFDIPESVPKWRELASVHGIETEQTGDTWESRYDDFGTLNRSTDHETEKEAVISLIHKMELKGWREVSL